MKKKTINETLVAFRADPISAENIYREKKHHWYLEDTKQFFRCAMAAHPDNDLKETAFRLISFLHENECLDYSEIWKAFAEHYEYCGYTCDVGLKSFTYEYFVDYYDEWLDDSDDNELKEAVAQAEEVWYWRELLTYCVEVLDYEYNFVQKVVDSIERW